MADDQAFRPRSAPDTSLHEPSVSVRRPQRSASENGSRGRETDVADSIARPIEGITGGYGDARYDDGGYGGLTSDGPTDRPRSDRRPQGRARDTSSDGFGRRDLGADVSPYQDDRDHDGSFDADSYAGDPDTHVMEPGMPEPGMMESGAARAEAMDYGSPSDYGSGESRSPRRHGGGEHRRPRPDRPGAGRAGAAAHRGEGTGGLAGWWHSAVASGDVMRWAPVGLIGLAVVGLLGFAMSSGGDDENAASTAATPAVAAATPTSIEAQPMQSVETTAPVQKTVLERTITQGVYGDDVKQIQERLIELGYDPGGADGHYGEKTISAVWAYKKLVMGVPRGDVTNEITPEMWDEMQDPITVAPRRPDAASENHVEIYLPEQVMVVFHADQPRLISHIATGELDENGEPAEYCEEIEKTISDDGVPLEEPIPGESCGKAKTPGGIFTIGRMEDGYHEGSLGGMWEPVYFNYMIAIHGAINVPLAPASHGCVRIERHISAYFQDIVAKGDQVYVWNGEKEPEEVTKDEALPWFDRFTPDTTVPQTAAPVATQAPAATQAPVAETTTTVAAATTTTKAPTTTTTTKAPTTTTTTKAPTTTTTTVAAGGGAGGASGQGGAGNSGG